ncbi:MAG: hypothetical protein ACRDE2_17350 [Chitinophagaceae bacterium]
MKKLIFFFVLIGQGFLLKAQELVLFLTKSLTNTGIQQINAQTKKCSEDVV